MVGYGGGSTGLTFGGGGPPASTDEWWGNRGVFAGGEPSASNSNVIDFRTISTTGNASDFGDLADNRDEITGASDGTTMLTFGGWTTWSQNQIQKITIGTLGNASDFGDCTGTISRSSAVCNGLYAVNFCGNSGSAVINRQEWVYPQQPGDATDFGDNTKSRGWTCSFGSATRGICAGGQKSNSSNEDTIDYMTYSSLGNATDFGNLEYHTRGSAGCDNEGVRGLIMGGVNDGGYTNMTRYVTIASTGDGTNFGDLQADVRGYVAGASNGSRGVCAGGYTGSAHSNVMEYYTIASTGQATDLGDLTEARNGLAGAAGD